MGRADATFGGAWVARSRWLPWRVAGGGGSGILQRRGVEARSIDRERVAVVGVVAVGERRGRRARVGGLEAGALVDPRQVDVHGGRLQPERLPRDRELDGLKRVVLGP